MTLTIDVPLTAATAQNATSAAAANEAAEAQARATVRQVVSTVNRYRDGRFTKVVAARNQLLTTAGLLILATYLILVIAIIWRWSQIWPWTWNSARGIWVAPALGPAIFWPDMLLGAMVLYLVGAIFGLLYRLYGESKAKRAIDDYGLSMTRLVTSPAFSGLAAVLGVLLTYVVFNIAGITGSDGAASGLGDLPKAQVAAIFDLGKYPVTFIIAALFGMTPNVIIAYLQKQTKRYIGEIESTETTETGTESED